jgi:hypothetical protein
MAVRLAFGGDRLARLQLSVEDGAYGQSYVQRAGERAGREVPHGRSGRCRIRRLAVHRAAGNGQWADDGCARSPSGMHYSIFYWLEISLLISECAPDDASIHTQCCSRGHLGQRADDVSHDATSLGAVHGNAPIQQGSL